MSSINETITAVVSEELGEDTSVYTAAINAVSKALEEREYDITESVIEAAMEHTGFTRDEIEAEAVRAGLSLRPKPEPVVEEEPAAEAEPASIEDRVVLLEAGQAQLQEGMNTLLAVAKRLAPSEF